MRITFTIAILAISVSQLVAAADTSSSQQQQQVSSSSASTPPCFLKCAAQSATEINCKGATDLPCYCPKQDFMIANAKCTMQQCPDLAMNVTLNTASFQQLGNLCKQAVGSFNLTVPTAAELGMSNKTQTPNTAATPASASAAKPQSGQQPAVSSSSASGSALPPISCIVPTVIAVSTLLAGVTLLM